ncbi:unnamed protein product [Nezara viridula]|uniref:Uncharacterized protein n=1 Tax=Nezara viridula TaxID=85310 RepID=A0A9P0GWS8_NEZVI|nr:unnamed protein product [Nezara viridula]
MVGDNEMVIVSSIPRSRIGAVRSRQSHLYESMLGGGGESSWSWNAVWNSLSAPRGYLLGFDDIPYILEFSSPSLMFRDRLLSRVPSHLGSTVCCHHYFATFSTALANNGEDKCQEERRNEGDRTEPLAVGT